MLEKYYSHSCCGDVDVVAGWKAANSELRCQEVYPRSWRTGGWVGPDSRQLDTPTACTYLQEPKLGTPTASAEHADRPLSYLHLPEP